jgi:Asp-tRNA(Asn)/Glu-tRNA(Gln) amidotransferase B subunit
MEAEIADTPLRGVHLAELVAMVDGGELSATAAKEVLGGVLGAEGSVREIAERRNLIQISDAGALERVVDEVIAAHPDEFSRLRGGEGKLVGFFVGRVMQATAGRADPRLVGELIRNRAG